MTLRLVPLQETHLEDAAALACGRYRALRARVPSLPCRYDQVEALAPLLAGVCGRACPMWRRRWP